MSVARYFNRYLRRRVLSGQEPGWLKRHPRREYIVMACCSSVEWADAADLKLLRAWSKAMTIFTGVPHVLDHEIPLCHRYVCGLTVPANLRIVPHAVNAAKGNNWHPDQLGLF